MSKSKKSLIIAISIIVISFLAITLSFAVFNYEEMYINYTGYIQDDSILCIEQGQHINDSGAIYYKVGEGTIEGTKLHGEDEYGTIDTDNWDNAKLAYILCSDETGPTKEGSPLQNAIWQYLEEWSYQQDEWMYEYIFGPLIDYGNDNGYTTDDLLYDAEEYADNITDYTETGITENYDYSKENGQQPKVDTVILEHNGKTKTRIGPFNYTFPGDTAELTVYGTDLQGNEKEVDYQLSTFEGNYETYIDQISSNEDFYILIDNGSQIAKITKISLKTSYTVNCADIQFWDTDVAGWQAFMTYTPYEKDQDIDTDFKYDIPLVGSLKIVKQNKQNNDYKLNNVEFIVKNKETGLYVALNSDGSPKYVKNESEAKVFKTGDDNDLHDGGDGDGTIYISNLIVGNYIVYEKNNPNYGYEAIVDGLETTITAGGTVEFKIDNNQKWIKLSGYVWIDKQSGKTSVRNDLFKDNEYDENDILKEGITVRLKDKNGNIVDVYDPATGKVSGKSETQTDKNGSYLFGGVLAENIGNYYMEFEYDGLTYTNVTSHIDKDNGSKAGEDSATRSKFNEQFTRVEDNGKASDNVGTAIGQDGNKSFDLTYDYKDHTSTLVHDGKYNIQANTDVEKYSIKDNFKYGEQDEVKNINLGLYEREQPDIAVVKDIDKVKLSINKKDHVYDYGQRFENQEEYGDGFNVGVKYGSKYEGMSYSRAIYKADYEYTYEGESNQDSRELKVYITYKIAIKNQSTNLVSQINNIAEYYDSRYDIVAVGTKEEENGSVSGELAHTETAYNTDYKKSTITTNLQVNPQETTYVYVQFKLNRDAVLAILNSRETLDNVVEINSYSTFDKENKIYAGVDKDSAPGNAVPGDKTTYEDDTDLAPSLQLEVTDAREISGKVFEDSTTGELMTGNVRQGDGEYTNGEKGIQGVNVKFTENSGTGKEYTAITNQDGDFSIAGFIPGDYTVTYIWGDTIYTVQKYKGTIYDSSRDQTNTKWYKDNVDKRLTDALDNYETRQKIDDELKEITNSTQITIDKMDSITPKMDIGVEYETTATSSEEDKYVYSIKNVDFGIVERARQSLAMTKRINSMKVTLANGQVVSNITIDENGNIVGDNKYLTYMKPSQAAEPRNGFLKLELDNELIEGAKLEVTYEIKAINNSELDYTSENFYKYGDSEGGTVVTISPSAIIDYLDNDWAFDSSSNTGWEVKTLEQIKDSLAEVVYNNENSTINEKTILYTEKLKDQKLAPIESASVMLNVSKLLSNSDEISLDNETEVIKVTKDGGSELTSIPGNYVPGIQNNEPDGDESETVIVTPSTGENQNYVLPITIGVSILAIFGLGITLIKKLVLKNK